MHMHTGHTHTDLALHEPDSYTRFVWEPLIAVDPFHPGQKAPRDANIWIFFVGFLEQKVQSALNRESRVSAEVTDGASNLQIHAFRNSRQPINTFTSKRLTEI